MIKQLVDSLIQLLNRPSTEQNKISIMELPMIKRCNHNCQWYRPRDYAKDNVSWCSFYTDFVVINQDCYQYDIEYKNTVKPF